MRGRWWVWLLGALVGLAMLAIAVAFFIDDPLRHYVEREMNSRLQGYTVRIGKLDLHPLNVSVDLYEVTIVQDANPDPPIVHVPNLDASVHWRALLSGRVVSDILIDRPNVHINLKQVRDEAADEVPVQERGWQEALQAVMPLQINEVQVIDGTVIYIDEAPFRPLHLSQLQFRAGNIRNVRSEAGVYPSPLSLEGKVFDAGSISLNGHADFLAVPHIAIKAQLGLENTEGRAVAKVTGKFMGSGEMMVGATFLPEIKGPHFALAASIENTEMRTMNNLLRAHANLDVVRGFFSVYAELRVRDGMVRGYVKPLFREMDVYDPRQDREKGLFQKVYEALVGGVSELLENVPRDEVATKAEISGRLDNPQASTWQVLVRLIQNAFFEAILPGFERELGRAGR